jgi:hypothetical protein
MRHLVCHLPTPSFTDFHAAQILQRIGRRSRLPMPRRPRMPQVMEPKIVYPCLA